MSSALPKHIHSTGDLPKVAWAKGAYVHDVDGKQYIAVTTGLGGGSPENMPNVILTDVHRPDNGQAVYVFALPD